MSFTRGKKKETVEIGSYTRLPQTLTHGPYQSKVGRSWLWLLVFLGSSESCGVAAVVQSDAQLSSASQSDGASRTRCKGRLNKGRNIPGCRRTQNIRLNPNKHLILMKSKSTLQMQFALGAALRAW